MILVEENKFVEVSDNWGCLHNHSCMISAFLLLLHNSILITTLVYSSLHCVIEMTFNKFNLVL